MSWRSPRNPGIGRLAAAAAVAGAVATTAATLTPAPLAAQQSLYVRQTSPAWLGVNYELRWIQHGDSCSPQVVVEGVVQGSPADRAGLRAGDAILALDGDPAPASRLRSLSARLVPGDSIRLEFRRDGAVRVVTAVADRRPERPLRGFVERPGGLQSSTTPIIEQTGDTLVARNVGPDWDPGRTRGYWVLQGNGQAEYRSLSGWSRSRLDRRVNDLLSCADQAQVRQPVWAEGTAPLRVDVREIQARADSLRVLLARRALERQDAEGVEGVLTRIRSGDGGEPTTVHLFSPEGSYTFRVEDHVALGLRAVAGAELTALEPELADYFRNADEGLLVLRIAPDTPAERAGLRPGDVVRAANGRRVESVAELRRIIALPDAGAVELRVIRKGRSRELTLRRDPGG